jgi:dTDP-4-dehydrorhamnose reductase
MRVLITGSTGQIGRELVAAAHDAGFEPIAPGRQQLDITDTNAVRHSIFANSPTLVINAAAYTAVDRAESETEQAFATNARAPGIIAGACAELGIPLIHISTDYVFDGTSGQAYCEDDTPAPLNVYGRSKWEGEVAVRQMLRQHLILRVSAVFGAHGRNFVQAIVQRSFAGEELRVVADQRTCPTPAADIARVILRLIQALAVKSSPPWGTYHYCGAPPVTWYEFAGAIVDVARKQQPSIRPRLVSIMTSEYAAQACRPQHSVLDCHKIARAFQIQQHPWHEGLSTAVASALAAAP